MTVASSRHHVGLQTSARARGWSQLLMRVDSAGMNAVLTHLAGYEIPDRTLLYDRERLLVIVPHDENAEIALILILHMGPLPGQLPTLPYTSSRINGVVVSDITPGATGKVPSADTFKP